MNKNAIPTILIGILLLSLSLGVALAKKPDSPPGRQVEEADTFEIFVASPDVSTHMTVTLVETILPYDPPGTHSFMVNTSVGDWDYADGVDGGAPGDMYRWSFWDGAYGEPMIAYGIFEFDDVFRNGSSENLPDGYDFRPDDIDFTDDVHTGYAHLLSVGRGVNADDQMDWSYFSLEWTKIVDGKHVNVLFLGRTLLDRHPEGIFTCNEDDTVASWEVSFSTDGTSTNTEFRFMYSWYTEIARGKTGKGKVESQYHAVRIWDLDGGTQPTIPISVTTTVNRLSNP